ncbi:SCAR-like protein 1 isoform X2 [Neltuma alba]|uniref:SCAR-like protein 1 isoform X2 n=1 Tax=Neltuma alba TaxID=207710 RepID=UPI0010A2B48E|nr:SCAR-like protein 1 isoform X2 [Prosopis alba]
MPIARYQLKSELSLADPELYRVADKDDPETVLEAVALAGLVGLLRQLGDLSQFAAEIFRDLHEEVMVTAARGQGLMARAQQLEAEVPSLEKAFLSQPHHLSFFSKGELYAFANGIAGIGWHPNLRSEQNLITRGDMPRFVMDSYEECRGPPQLFLLDKFDVAGAGACLKRYTDPSFFKSEPASSGLATVEVFREKKNHRIKKKGTRMRNGETPEVASTHTKLHQLLLEERIESACADPGRQVKLKNRQLNGSATETKTGKSYMEKFLESPLQDEVVRETSFSPPHVRLVSDDTSEEGIKILEISTVGPVKMSLENERTCSWTNEEEAVLKPSSEKRRQTDGNLVKKHEQGSSRVSDERSYNYSEVPHETKLEIDDQKEGENFLYGYHSDGDLSGEVDHHLNALATVESELDTGYKYRDKNRFLRIQNLKDSDDRERQQRDRFLHSQSFSDSLVSDEISSFNRDINEVHAERQAQLSDSQSGISFTSDDQSSLKRDRNEEYSKRQAQFSDFQYIGKSSASDMNSSFDKDIPCFSCSDSLSTVGENITSEPVSLKSNKYNRSEIEDTSSNQLTQIFEAQKTDRGKFLLHGGTRDQEKVVSGTGDESSGSYLINSGRKSLYSDLASASMMKISNRDQSKETPTGLIEHQLRLADEGTRHHAESIDAIPDATVSSEKGLLNESADGDRTVNGNAILNISNDLKLVSDNERSGCSKIKGLQAESPSQNCSDILVCREIGTDEHSICSSTELDMHSLSTTLMLDVQPLKPADCTESTHLNSQDESDSVGVEAECYDQQSYFGELPEMEHSDELSGSTCRVDADEDDNLHKGSSSGVHGGQDYHVTDDVAYTELQPEDQSVSVDAAENDANIASYPASSMISSASRNLSNLQEPIPGTCSHETKMESNQVEQIKIAVDSNAENRENEQEPSSDSNMVSTSMTSSTSFEESHFSFADPQEKQREISEAVDRESLRKLEKQGGVHQLNAACANVELSLNRSVPCDNSEICESIKGSLPKEQTEHSSVKDKILKFSKLDSQEPKSIPLLRSKRLRNGQDGLASSFFNQLESGNRLKKSSQLQDGQGDAGFLPSCAEISSSNKHQPEQVQISEHLEKERNSSASSTSVSEIHLGQSSSFESFSISVSQKVNSTKHVMNEPLSPLQASLSEAPKINFGEMPPMPPLPPMQWRTGKVQPFSLASNREVSFQPIQSIKSGEQAQYSLPISEREALQFQNPVISVMAVEGEKLQNTSGFLVGGHPVAISMQLPIMLNEVNGKYNYLVLERSQTHNPFLTSSVPVVPAGKPAEGYIGASEGEMVQNSNTSSPIPPVERAISEQDSISPEELSQPPSQPSLKVKTLQRSADNLEGKQGDPSNSPMSPPGMENVQPIHNLLPSEGKQGDPSDSPMSPPVAENVLPDHNLPPSEGKQGDDSNSPRSPPGMENMHPDHNLLRSGNEMASTLDKSALASDFERERLNGKPNDKLPRPRSPVIDAVAALDKSKLRKVAERGPPKVPKIEERDSFLEQIRTKSFNLRPAATRRNRYHYQGPRTNLKVAAILEKANAIRQALAGSDEDDEKDGWSDS